MRKAGGAETVRIGIRVRPGSSRDRVGGDHDGSLVVAITAPAVDGRATDAALRLLAKTLGLRRAEVTLVTGATSRSKVVSLPADAFAAAEALRTAPSAAAQASGQ